MCWAQQSTDPVDLSFQCFMVFCETLFHKCPCPLSYAHFVNIPSLCARGLYWSQLALQSMEWAGDITLWRPHNIPPGVLNFPAGVMSCKPMFW